MKRILIEPKSSSVDSFNAGIVEAIQFALNNNIKEIGLVVPAMGTFPADAIEKSLGEKACKALKKGQKIIIYSDISLSLHLARNLSISRNPSICIATYLTNADLDILDSNQNIEAIVFVPWMKDEAMQWLTRWRSAIDVIGDKNWNKEIMDTQLHPDIENALKTLIYKSVTHNTDKEQIKAKLKSLRDQGHSLSTEATKNWAIKNGWTNTNAKSLEDIVATIFK